MVSLITDVVQAITQIEEEKPLNVSKIEAIANALFDKVLFFQQEENKMFYRVYEKDCIALTNRMSVLTKSLTPEDPEADDAKVRIQELLNLTEEALGMKEAQQPSARTKLVVPAVSKNAKQSSCGKNTCPIIAVAVAVVGMTVALLRIKSLI